MSIDNKKNQFLKFVVCRKCFKLYKLEDCFRVIEGKKQSNEIIFGAKILEIVFN